MKRSAIFGLAGLAFLVAGCDSLTQTGVNEETATGLSWFPVTEPLPSWPEKSLPQQKTAPLVVTAQV